MALVAMLRAVLAIFNRVMLLDSVFVSFSGKAISSFQTVLQVAHIACIQLDANGSRRAQSTRTSFFNLSTNFLATSAGEPSSISVFFCFCGT